MHPTASINFIGLLQNAKKPLARFAPTRFVSYTLIEFEPNTKRTNSADLLSAAEQDRKRCFRIPRLLGTELFGGAYKFLSELGPCALSQGPFFIKKLPAKIAAASL
jgi:hypothetical protein